MADQTLALDYANAIADQLWELDDTGEIFPHECECDDHDRDACADCQLCMDDLGAWGYLRDVLDIEYRVGGGGDYRSARVMIAFGGPNAWIDTKDGTLTVHWDREAVRTLPKEFCEELDNELENVYQCTKL